MNNHCYLSLIAFILSLLLANPAFAQRPSKLKISYTEGRIHNVLQESYQIKGRKVLYLRKNLYYKNKRFKVAERALITSPLLLNSLLSLQKACKDSILHLSLDALNIEEDRLKKLSNLGLIEQNKLLINAPFYKCQLEEIRHRQKALRRISPRQIGGISLHIFIEIGTDTLAKLDIGAQESLKNPDELNLWLAICQFQLTGNLFKGETAKGHLNKKTFLHYINRYIDTVLYL